jgi:hypothetical protein
VCGREFKAARHLSLHLRTHTRGNINNSGSNNETETPRTGDDSGGANSSRATWPEQSLPSVAAPAVVLSHALRVRAGQPIHVGGGQISIENAIGHQHQQGLWS